MSDPDSSIVGGSGNHEAEANPLKDNDRKETMNEFIDAKMREYKTYNITDKDLWESLREDFQGFTQEEIATAPTSCLRCFRDFLRHHGVYVLKNGSVPPSISIFKTIYENDPEEWPQHEILEYLKTKGNFNSEKINRYLRENDIPFSTITFPSDQPNPSSNPSKDSPKVGLRLRRLKYPEQSLP